MKKYSKKTEGDTKSKTRKKSPKAKKKEDIEIDFGDFTITEYICGGGHTEKTANKKTMEPNEDDTTH